jgi:putative ABC transport system permease protein
MVRVALANLAGRKLRTVLTALAIVLGVSMASGTFVLTDTLNRAVDNLFRDSYTGTSVVVSGREYVGSSLGGAATLPANLLAKVRAVDGVAAADGAVTDFQTKLVGREGKVLGGMGGSLSFGADEWGRFNPMRLTDGAWPHHQGETVIDKGTAARKGYRVGDTIGVAARGPVRRFQVVGIARFVSLDSLGGATIALFDLKTAQGLFGKEGRLDTISVAGARGVDATTLRDRIAHVLPPTAQAKTAQEQSESDAADAEKGISFIGYFLLAFAGVALFVGAFVIFNTLSITIAQRAREFAVLRTLGASRRQVLATVVVEALALGLLASLAGLFLGLGLAEGLYGAFKHSDLALPSAGMVFGARTIVLSLLVGTAVTLVAGLAPAIRATRVPPIAAAREGAVLPPSRVARFLPHLAGASVVVAAAALAYGMFADTPGTMQRLQFLGLGSFLLFVGIASVSPRLVRPLASALGRPAQALGGEPGRLARENATRNPARTAVTAAALMIGLALVTFVAVLAQGLRQSVGATIDRQVRADYIVSSASGFSEPFPTTAAEVLEHAPVVAAASSVRLDVVRIGRADRVATGIDPRTILRLYKFDWKQGSDQALGQLAPNGALLTENLARRRNAHLGDSVALTTPQGKQLSFVVKGIYKPPALGSLLGDVSIAQTTFDRSFARAGTLSTFIDVRGAPTAAKQAALAAILKDYPEAEVRTHDGYVDQQQQGISMLLNIVYVLLALSVIVSLFGMINTLVLSVHERTRELGLLRTIGMTRRQTRRMVRYESTVTALIGAALGLPLGLLLAALATRALADEGVVFALPVWSLLVFVLIAFVAGRRAAIAPARRAARLNVLQALHYE